MASKSSFYANQTTVGTEVPAPANAQSNETNAKSSFFQKGTLYDEVAAQASLLAETQAARDDALAAKTAAEAAEADAEQTAADAATLIANSAVRYDVAQTLTGPQQTQARSNIAAAPLASPGLTGTPTAPTAADGTNTTQIATTGFVQSAINLLKAGVAAAGDTLAELYTLITTHTANVSNPHSVTKAQVGLGSVTNNAQVVDPAANGIVVRTAAGAASARTIAQTTGRTLVTNGDGVSGNPTISVPLQMSLTSDASGLKLVNDSSTPGNNKVYGTDASGVLGYKPDPTGSGGGSVGMKNRLINPTGRIFQRGAPSAPSGADDTYAFDRWNVLTQSNPVTPSQVLNAENTTPVMMRLTQANAVAQRFGAEQIIEACHSINMRGQQVTFSGRVRMSVATTLRYAILEWTSTADAVTSDVVNDWTSVVFASGGFFIGAGITVTGVGSIALAANTLTNISLTATFGSSLNNAIVLLWTDSTQAQNVTLDFGKMIHEIGASASTFEERDIATELQLCQRYYMRRRPSSNAEPLGMFHCYSTTQAWGILWEFPVEMRINPTAGRSAVGDFAIWNAAAASEITATSFTTATSTKLAYTGNFTVASGIVAGDATMCAFKSTSTATAYIDFDAEL